MVQLYSEKLLWSIAPCVKTPSGPTAATNAAVKRFVKKRARCKKGGEGTDTAPGGRCRTEDARVVLSTIFTARQIRDGEGRGPHHLAGKSCKQPVSALHSPLLLLCIFLHSPCLEFVSLSLVSVSDE